MPHFARHRVLAATARSRSPDCPRRNRSRGTRRSSACSRSHVHVLSDEGGAAWAGGCGAPSLSIVSARTAWLKAAAGAVAGDRGNPGDCARLCEPASELHIAEDWYRRTALDDLLGAPAERINDDRLYRALASSALNLANVAPRLLGERGASASASPSLGPGNMRPEFCSQTALRLANRPKLREFLWIRKPRRLPGLHGIRTRGSSRRIAYRAVRHSRTTKIGHSDFGPGDGSAFAMRCRRRQAFPHCRTPCLDPVTAARRQRRELLCGSLNE
jgi:hypothetical protein